MIRQRLRGIVEAWLLRVWFGPSGPADRLLYAMAFPLMLPLSRLVAAAARRRRRRIVKQVPPRGTAPVVIVGNLVAGGSGKTPLVAAIARGLAAAGFRPGLLAGGYGSRREAGRKRAATLDAGAIMVDENSEPAEVGDEAVLLFHQTGFPLAVGKRRGAAADLLRRSHPDCDVIVSDDGLQHVGLARQIELLVIDERGFGNRRCLPAGPLREPADRVETVDATIFTSPKAAAACTHPVQFHSALRTTCFRTLDGSAAWSAEEFASRFAGEPLAAIAGIARPARFFSSLQAFGLYPRCHPLPDHGKIDEEWLDALAGRWILMTGKDAVKCRRFGAALLARCICVDVAAEPEAALLKWLAAQLRPAAHRNG